MGIPFGRPMYGNSGAQESNPLLAGQEEIYPHRWRVVFLSWFQLVFGALGSLRGRLSGMTRLGTGVLGVYATWPPCENKNRHVLFYSILNLLWASGSLFFLLLLVAGDFGFFKSIFKYTGSSEVFPEFGDKLGEVVSLLHKKNGNAMIFPAILDVVFLFLSAVWGFSLYSEITRRNRAGLPVTRASGYGSDGAHYFPGSGQRLGR
ncbi:hypothetical protein NDN08_005459 [Rhodosorus marinus]|uniref:Uncharacterized protein n=1 Tax=Rhodosorus marinus TaxID=101924 RepID=A0AAV8V3B1_9RHOD|nr:hypothetical protein NDN08_005459 [Rhodosorus marinus]